MQQAHFSDVALFLEHLNGVLGGHLVAPYGQVGINNLLHALAYLVNVVGRYLVPYFKVNEVTVRHRYVDYHVRNGVDVVHGLAENKEERAGVVA